MPVQLIFEDAAFEGQYSMVCAVRCHCRSFQGPILVCRSNSSCCGITFSLPQSVEAMRSQYLDTWRSHPFDGVEVVVPGYISYDPVKPEAVIVPSPPSGSSGGNSGGAGADTASAHDGSVPSQGASVVMSADLWADDAHAASRANASGPSAQGHVVTSGSNGTALISGKRVQTATSTTPSEGTPAHDADAASQTHLSPPSSASSAGPLRTTHDASPKPVSQPASTAEQPTGVASDRESGRECAADVDTPTKLQLLEDEALAPRLQQEEDDLARFA